MLHVDPASAAVDAVPAGPVPVDPARALVERQLAMLTRLAEIGMEIAEAAPAAADPALTYARVARAVRMTIALQSRLLKDLAALDRTDALARSAQVQARTRRIHRLVEQAIETQHDDEDEIERLSGDAWERLRDEDDCADLFERPIAETVARICRELGLSPPDPLLPLREKLSAEPTDEGLASGSATPASLAATEPPPDPAAASASFSPRGASPREPPSGVRPTGQGRPDALQACGGGVLSGLAASA
jgi:hypothetical protein